MTAGLQGPSPFYFLSPCVGDAHRAKSKQKGLRQDTQAARTSLCVMLAMILQNSVCKRYTLSMNHTRRTLLERELPHLGGSAPPVTYILPDRTILDCVAKAWEEQHRTSWETAPLFRDQGICQ